jgi:hypothetical protein
VRGEVRPRPVKSPGPWVGSSRGSRAAWPGETPGGWNIIRYYFEKNEDMCSKTKLVPSWLAWLQRCCPPLLGFDYEMDSTASLTLHLPKFLVWSWTYFYFISIVNEEGNVNHGSLHSLCSGVEPKSPWCVRFLNRRQFLYLVHCIATRYSEQCEIKSWQLWCEIRCFTERNQNNSVLSLCGVRGKSWQLCLHNSLEPVLGLRFG